jgi:hypothetical protein
MTLGDLQGWTLAAIIAKHETTGGSYDYETREFLPPEERPQEDDQ